MKKRLFLILVILGLLFAFAKCSHEIEYFEPDCGGVFGTPGTTPPDDLADYMDIALNVIRFVGIVCCVLFTVIDYFKAIMADEKEMLKEISKKALKRLIYVAILFFIPSVTRFIMEITGLFGNHYDPLCGLK